MIEEYLFMKTHKSGCTCTGYINTNSPFSINKKRMIKTLLQIFEEGGGGRGTKHLFLAM